MYFTKFFNSNKEDKASIYDYIKRIKEGENHLRDKVISNYTPFILRVASEISGKYISVTEDDEYTIAMAAFNEAISCYDFDKRYNFLLFAELVIKRKIDSYYKKNIKERNTYPFTYFSDLDESWNDFEQKYLVCDSYLRFEDIEKREELESLTEDLRGFGIKISDLLFDSPKHQDSIKLCIEIAKIITSDNDLYNKLVVKKNIPRNEVLKRIDVHRRTIENNRKYIIAICLILKSDYELSKYIINSITKGGSTKNV